MEGSVNILTRTAILLESDMFGTLLVCYMCLCWVLFVSFINIYSVDKYEFLTNTQKCIEFKRKVFFVIHYSKHKYIVSLKTFVMELIGYMLGLTMIVSVLFSLNINVSLAFIVVAVFAIIILTFGCITGSMYRKTKHKK